MHTVCVCACLDLLLTVVWDDGPGHGGRVDAPEHPEHAQPAQVLASLLLGQEFRIIGKHDGNGAPDAARRKEKKGWTKKDDKRRRLDHSNKGKEAKPHFEWNYFCFSDSISCFLFVGFSAILPSLWK